MAARMQAAFGRSRNRRTLGVAALLAILVVGFVYEWMKGALEWE